MIALIKQYKNYKNIKAICGLLVGQSGDPLVAGRKLLWKRSLDRLDMQGKISSIPSVCRFMLLGCHGTKQ